jgi:hypothetical protein
MKLNKNIKQYLKSGPQTKITFDIKILAKSFRKRRVDLVFEILTWLHKNLKERTGAVKDTLFRQRTAQEIIDSKFVIGCTDWALAFIILARAKKIPAIYVETIRKKWLDVGKKNFIEGHVFVEVYINKHWYIIDPEQAAIKSHYDRWVIFKKGLDSWDIGIRNFNELKKQFLEFRRKYKNR